MAVGDVRIRVTETGYTELIAKIKDTGPWLAKPYREGMGRIGDVAASAARFGAPVGSTGRTVSNIRSSVSAAKIPKFVRIDELAKDDHGFPYPRVLEFSPYARSRGKVGKNKHQYWMRNAITAVIPEIDRIFDEVADDVERQWAQ